MNVKELAAASVVEVRAAVEQYSHLKGFSLNSTKGAIAITKEVVKHVEEIGLRDGLAGADKKELAIELVILIVKPGFFLEKVLRFVLPYVIDAVVDALKDKFGK